MPERQTKPDLDSPEQIKAFIESFYDKVLADNLLAHIFTDVAGIDINVHIPIIRSYWEKLLLGDKQYQRHTMNIHRDLHSKFPFTEPEFDRWLSLFKQTASEEFSGPNTDRAVTVASSIAHNMNLTLNKREGEYGRPE
jgi:hemoglobin